MYQKNIVYLAFFIANMSYCAHSFSQSAQYADVMHNRSITIHTDDHHKQVFHVRKFKRKPHLDRTYFWYDARTIHTSQGGYSGKVLNGEFSEYYPDKGIHRKGVFKNGTKRGRWSEWNRQGQLSKWSTWKSGIEKGDYQRYDSAGKVIEGGKLLGGLRNGKIYDYSLSESAPIIKYYYRGAEVSMTDYYQQQNIWTRSMHYLDGKWQRIVH